MRGKFGAQAIKSPAGTLFAVKSGDLIADEVVQCRTQKLLYFQLEKIESDVKCQYVELRKYFVLYLCRYCY